MLEIKNGYPHAITVTGRHVNTGTDSGAVTVEPGATAEIEIDGQTQAVIASTEAVKPGEVPMQNPPTATIQTNEAGNDTSGGAEGGGELPRASDELVSDMLSVMKSEGTNLTQTGKPELPVLNERLKDAGYAPIDAKRRDEVFGTLQV